jgi:hypothetical protein
VRMMTMMIMMIGMGIMALEKSDYGSDGKE